MIELNLSEEQSALKEMVRKFVEKEVTPQAAHFDETGEFPREIIQHAWELGIMNTAIPQEFGGLGLGVLDEVIINEELGAGCLGVTTSVMVNNLALYPILLGGTDQQIKDLVVPFLESPKLGAFCLSEPGSGSDAGSLSTTATESGDDYVLNGSKMWISNAGVADLFSVFATVDKSLKTKGILCLAVDAKSPGIHLGKPENKMGQRASDTQSHHFRKREGPQEEFDR